MNKSHLFVLMLLAVVTVAGCNREGATSPATPGTNVQTKASDDLKQEAIQLKRTVFANILNGETPDRKSLQQLLKTMERAASEYPRDSEMLRESADFYFKMAEFRKAAKQFESLADLGESQLTVE